MKRIALGALIALLGSVAIAEESHRYLVMTRQPARDVETDLRRTLGVDVQARRITTFQAIDGYAATLTSSEVATLRRSPAVRWIEPAVARHLMADSPLPGRQIIPAGVTQVRATQAWAGRRVVDVHVAVLDSGVDFNHPDLASTWAGGFNATPAGGSPMDQVSHGTHVAGTISAVNNRAGVIGVAPGVRLWGIRVIDEKGEGTAEEVMRGMDWVLARKAELGGRWVVNISLGGDEASEAERELFRKAVDAGVIVVAATGNDSTVSAVAPIAYPAAYPGVIAVAAVNGATNVRGVFSNAGPELQFMAPGVSVLSTVVSGSTFASYVRVSNVAASSKPLVGSRIEPLSGAYVSCGFGDAADFTAAVRGKIALIQRGGDTFADKTRRAVAAGAKGVVFYNINNTNNAWTLLPPEDPDASKFPWPVAVGLSLPDGKVLAERGSGFMTIGYESDAYGSRSGTSMAAPHVTGAVALLWAMAPNATREQITRALADTAIDLGAPGRDELHGYGTINVEAAARLLAPEAFTPSTRSGRPFVARGSH